ncbi:transglycosylase domain-containing protein [Nocardioides pocheonensis]|uniref:Penicillin-binding protein n=1 Tax=Nocardioides pocheonensis TaxID=661485 RepID=A0A3N0GKB6_9ACTN|nr:transglycosylase domain-containing protein [Nocardioides pocheonensis]RNM12568.1 penicillin-binding protein [Nocardioides pocheonensis]
MSASTPRSGASRSDNGPRNGNGGRSRGTTSRKAAKPKLTGKERARRIAKYGLIAGLVGALVLSAMFYIAYRATDIPDPNQAFQAQTTNVYYAGGKTKIGRFATQNRESIPLADVPKVMQDAAVAAEDRTFWTNKGIDPKGIIRAAFSNAKGGATQGASTITQQYVKILYLSQERTIRRKIKEAFLSLKIQQQQSKSQILEGYLNTIYFGRGAYGIQAAANAYFGIPAKQLDASQSAMLAAILNSPNYLSPDRSDASRQALQQRYDYVVSGMEKMGSLSASDAAKIEGKLPDTKKQASSNTYAGQKGFMLSMVKQELLRLGFTDQDIDGGGLKVTTTFTKKAMDAAQQAVQQVAPTGVKALHAAVASVDVQTGGVLGFYSGQDYLKSQIDWATTALPPGSAFKPFAVAAGIKDGFSLKDTFDGNSPYTFPDGSTVVNEGEGTGTDFGAKVSLTTATAKSINTAFVDMTQSMDNGPQKIADMAQKLGVPPLKPEEINARISLGGAPVSPLNMANAYAAIADGGLHHSTFVVSKVVKASTGEVLYTAPRKTDQVLDSDVAADTSYAMQQVVKTGTGRAATALGRPAAGKTGTATNDDKRVITSWFVGFTPQVATAVTYSHGTGYKPIDEGYLPRGYFGATYPAETWTAAMKLLMDGVPVEDFPPPANLDGKAPSSGHDPYTPPPPKPKPTKKTSSAAPTTAAPQEPVANGVCDPAYGYPQDPDCPPPSPSPTPTPPSTSPPPILGGGKPSSSP